MSEHWGEGIREAAVEVVFDLEREAPEVFAALHAASPQATAECQRLRTALPVMASARPGEQGRLYRMRGHNRSVCIALGSDKASAEVIVLKGSEPLLPDFEGYLRWMRTRQFGNWPRPIAEHFPLFEGKAPATVFLDEALAECAIALDTQRRHLRHYGTLLRLPVPLLVFRLPPPAHHSALALLREVLPAPAFDRIEPHASRGLGVLAYHYPGPPARVNVVGRPAFLWPAPERLTTRQHVVETMVPAWITMAARLLWLGLLPATPLSWRLGTIFDPNNTCLDGGACDVGSIYPMDRAVNDGFFVRAVIDTVGSLRVIVARALGIALPELAQSYEQEAMSFYLGAFVKRALERALVTEARDTLTLDPRLALVFGEDKALPDLLDLFRTYRSYLSTDDYA